MSFRFRLRPLRALAAFAMLAASVTANAQITFTFDYSGNTPNVGFLDPTTGPARRAALETAGQRFSTLFSSHFSNSQALSFSVTSTVNSGGPVLASAASNFVQTPGTFGGGEVVRNKIINGTDINGGSADGVVDVNWGYDWELDYNTPAVSPGPGQTFDLYAALFHEFTHSLGFGTEISGTPGSDRFFMGAEGSGTQGSWAKWDQYLKDSSSTPLVNTSTFEVNQSAFANAQVVGGYFTGPNAMAAYGGNPVPLFPNQDQSHLDEATFSTPNVPENYMMKPTRDYGPQEARFWHPVEVGILTDIGYTAVPGPGALVTALFGAAPGAVLLLRRRRARTAHPGPPVVQA